MSEDGSAYKIEKPICCSVSTFLCSNYIWGVLSVGMLLVGIMGVTIQGGVLLVLPPQAYLAFIAFGAYSTIVIITGIFGQKSRIELCFLLYVLLMSLGLIAQTLGYCFLLLYAHDVTTIQTLDSAAIDAQATLENNLADFALQEPDAWRTAQNKLSCCGIDFEAGIEAADSAIIETGDLCFDADAVDALADLRINAEGELEDPDNFDEFGNFIPARDDETVGFKSEFFCKSKISVLVDEQTPVIAALIAILLLLQLIALVSASRLYWVPEFLGGWQFDDEELELVAERKGIPLPKNNHNGGNRVLSTLREQTNRLSFRIKNAYTADPEVPASAGFLNRLSLKRNALSGHGSFNGANDDMNTEKLRTFEPQQPVMPPNSNSNRSMFNRISQRLFTHSLIDMNAPPGLSPSASRELTPSGGFRPSQPSAPPSDMGMGGKSRLGRMSQRMQQGFQSVGSAFSGAVMAPRAPPQPPQPPQAFHRTGNSNPAMMNNLTDPRASNLSNGPPPPNTFMNQRQMSNPTLAIPGSYSSPPVVASTPKMSSIPMPPVAPTPAYNPPPMPVASTPSYNPPPAAPTAQAPRKATTSAPVPKKTSVSAPAAKVSMGGGGARGGLLAQIQMGKALKPTVTVDKSKPLV